MKNAAAVCDRRQHRSRNSTRTVLGEAASAATVTVNSQTTYRQNNYFREELAVNNSASPVWLSVTNVAIEYNAASPNIAATNNGNVFVPKTAQSFSYDADGNLTADGRWTYTWDAENRLITMVSATAVGPPQSIAFGYDWMGRRVSKTVWNNTTGTGPAALGELFVYDGWNLIGVLNSQSSLLQSFMWGLDLSGSAQGAGGIGGLLTANFYGAATTNCFATFDGNGNVAALVNAADGTTLADYEYGPFGEAIRATDPLAKANPIRFSTKFQDDETDFLYYGQRCYGSGTGRWINADPVGERGGINLYSYADNSPPNAIDPYGFSLVISISDRPFIPPYVPPTSYFNIPFTPYTIIDDGNDNVYSADAYYMMMVDPPIRDNSVAALAQGAELYFAVGSTAAIGADLGSENAALWAGYIFYEAGKNHDKSCPPLGMASPNNGIGPKHGGDIHNQMIDDFIKNLPANAQNIRKNQKQVDINGNQVGDNIPDVQYDLPGVHYNVEFDNNYLNSIDHFNDIFQNDPTSSIELTF